MRRFSVLFISLAIISLSTMPSRAQREIGGELLALDDGHGHVVNISIPTMTGPGPYSWILPITAGGSSLALPIPTTVGSMLYSNGTSSWLENTNIIATAAGGLTTNGSANIGSVAAAINIFGNGATSNDFAHNAANNAFGDAASGLNHFGVGAAANSFGAGATQNIFGSPGTSTSNYFGSIFSLFTTPTNSFGDPLGVGTATNTFGSPIEGGGAATNSFGCPSGGSGATATNSFGVAATGGIATNTFGTPSGLGTNTYQGASNFTGSVALGSSLVANVVVDGSGFYFVQPSDLTVIETGPGGFVLLPTASTSKGRVISIKNGSPDIFEVFALGGSIDGVGSIPLTVPAPGSSPPGLPSSITVTSDGTNWWIFAEAF